MVAIANFALLLVLSLFPSQKITGPDPHGLYRFAQDPGLRSLLTEGRFREFDAAVEGFVGMRLSVDLSKLKGQKITSYTAGEAIASRADLLGALDTIKAAMRVAAFAVELKTVGMAGAARMAVSWVESGLVRRSGLKPSSFPSFFGLLDGARDPGALEADLLGARALFDSSYGSMLGRLAETFL